MFLIVIIVWCAVTIVLAQALSRLIKSRQARLAAFLVLVPVILLLPVLDELIGKFQFDKLCKEAEDVKILATIPVREPFYTSDGKWRWLNSGVRLSRDDGEELAQTYKALVRYEYKGPTRVPGILPIYLDEWQIINRRSDAALAITRVYGTRGGWLSRRFETPAFVRAQCPSPAFLADLNKKILPFDQRSGDQK